MARCMVDHLQTPTGYPSGQSTVEKKALRNLFLRDMYNYRLIAYRESILPKMVVSMAASYYPNILQVLDSWAVL